MIRDNSQRHDVLMYGITIFAVVQQRNSKVVFGQISPFMTPYLSTEKRHHTNVITGKHIS